MLYSLSFVLACAQLLRILFLYVSVLDNFYGNVIGQRSEKGISSFGGHERQTEKEMHSFSAHMGEGLHEYTSVARAWRNADWQTRAVFQPDIFLSESI